MIWLMMHQWILLIAAFLLGLLIGWWLWSRPDTGQRRQKQAPAAQARAPIKSGAAFAEITSPAVAQALAADTGAGDMPPLYDAPSAGPADDLTKISGIGPRLEGALNDTGVYYFLQITKWTPAQIRWIDDRLALQGCIERDRWREQAAVLADPARPGSGSADSG